MIKVLREMIQHIVSSTQQLSEGLEYHIENRQSVADPIYRPGSHKFFDLILEAKSARKSGLITSDIIDPWLTSLDIGEWALFEGAEVPLDFPFPDDLDEAEYKGRNVSLGQPFRVSGGGHKFAVYVRDPKTKNVKKVQFGAPGLSVKLKSPARRKSFAARHRCEQKNDKTKPGYWACRVGRYPRLFGGNTYYRWW